MLPEATEDTNTNRRQVLETWIGPDCQSFYCPFGDRYCRDCYPDLDAASRKAAYCPMCMLNKEYACLLKDLRMTRARSKEAA
jgi:hypothetical protein